MKKNAKYLLIMLAVLVVLGGAAAALLLSSPSEEDASNSLSSDTSVTLTAVNPTEISSISIESSDYSYVIVPVEQREESASVSFTLEGYESGTHVDTTTLTTAANTVFNMKSSKELGAQSDLAKYGLKGEEAVTVTLKDSSGGEESFTVGIEGGETDGRYVLKDGSVYIVNGVSDYFFSDKFTFFEREVYTAREITVDTVNEAGEATTETLDDILYSAVITRSDLETPIEISCDYASGVYSMVSPVSAGMNASVVSDMIADLKSLTADKVIAEEKSEETLARFGLDSPYAEIVFNMNGEERTLKVSALDENNNRYIIEDYSKFIYQTDEATVNSWASTTVEDMRSSVILQPAISSVSSLDLTFEGDMVFTYEIEQVLDEANSTEEVPAYTYKVTTFTGSEMEFEQFSAIYSSLTGISLLSTEQPEAWSSEPTLSATYNYREGGSDTVEFFAVEGMDRYAVLLNGEFAGVVRSSDIDEFSY